MLLEFRLVASQRVCMQLHSANPQQAPGSPKNNTRKRRAFQHAIIAWIICLLTGSTTTLNFLTSVSNVSWYTSFPSTLWSYHGFSGMTARESMVCCVVLCCVVLCYVVLCCVVLWSVVLCWRVLCCGVFSPPSWDALRTVTVTATIFNIIQYPHNCAIQFNTMCDNGNPQTYELFYIVCKRGMEMVDHKWKCVRHSKGKHEQRYIYTNANQRIA